MGNVYADLGRKDEAIASYQKAIELDPKDAKAYNNLGIVYDDMGRKDEAIASYQKAIELDPKDASPYNSLGYLHLIDGNLKEAKINFEKAISINPEGYVAPINLGITYFQLKKKKRATSYFQSSLEKCPTNSVYGNLNKVTAMLGLERNEDALEILQRTHENFNIQQKEMKDFFQDWHLLAASSEPPAGIDEFIEQAKAILSYEEKL